MDPEVAVEGYIDLQDFGAILDVWLNKKAGAAPQVSVLTNADAKFLQLLPGLFCSFFPPQEPSVRPKVASMTLVSRKKGDSKSAPACEKPSTTATKAGFYFSHSQVENIEICFLVSCYIL